MPGWFRTAAAIAACLAAGCMGQAGQTDPDDYAPPAFTTAATPDLVREARLRFDEYWPLPEELPVACAVFAAHDWSYADAWAAANGDAPPASDDSPRDHTVATVNAIGRAVHDVVVPSDGVFAVVAGHELASDEYPRYPAIWSRADYADYEAAVGIRQREVTEALCAM